MAAVRHASRVEKKEQLWDSPRLQALIALAPLVSLNKACLVSGILTKVETTESDDHRLIATVRFPMPIWVPLAGPWFGERIVLPGGAINPETKRVIQMAFKLIGKSPPDLEASLNHLPYYRWITFQAEAPIEPPAMANDR
jgi:hypothetical protein